MFYYSRTGNVDVPMMAFTAIAIAAFASALRRPPSPAIALVLGCAAGFALATKEQTIGVFLAIAPVLLVQHAVRAGRAGWWRPRVWKIPALAIFGLVVAFGMGSGLFVDPTRFFAHLEFMQGRLDLVRAGGIAFVPIPDRSLRGSVELLRILGTFAAQVLSLPGLLLGVAGIALAIWRDRRAALLALPALSYLTLLFLAARTGQLRYLLPATFVIGLFAGWVLSQAWAARNRGVRVAGRIAAVWVLGLRELEPHLCDGIKADQAEPSRLARGAVEGHETGACPQPRERSGEARAPGRARRELEHPRAEHHRRCGRIEGDRRGHVGENSRRGILSRAPGTYKSPRGRPRRPTPGTVRTPGPRAGRPHRVPRHRGLRDPVSAVPGDARLLRRGGGDAHPAR
jgi:hypothetical protein